MSAAGVWQLELEVCTQWTAGREWPEHTTKIWPTTASPSDCARHSTWVLHLTGKPLPGQWRGRGKGQRSRLVLLAPSTRPCTSSGVLMSVMLTTFTTENGTELRLMHVVHSRKFYFEHAKKLAIDVKRYNILKYHFYKLPLESSCSRRPTIKV